MFSCSDLRGNSRVLGDGACLEIMRTFTAGRKTKISYIYILYPDFLSTRYLVVAECWLWLLLHPNQLMYFLLVRLFVFCNFAAGLEELDSVYASPSDFKHLNHKETCKGLALLEKFVKLCNEAQVTPTAWPSLSFKVFFPKKIYFEDPRFLNIMYLVVTTISATSFGLQPRVSLYVYIYIYRKRERAFSWSVKKWNSVNLESDIQGSLCWLFLVLADWMRSVDEEGQSERDHLWGSSEEKSWHSGPGQSRPRNSAKVKKKKKN